MHNHVPSRLTQLAAWSLALLGTAVLVIAPFACTDEGSLVGLHRPLHDFDPGPTDPGPIGSYTIPTPAGNVPAVDPAATGLILPASVPIRFIVQGLLTFSPNQAYFNCAGNWGTQPPWTQLGPPGTAVVMPMPYVTADRTVVVTGDTVHLTVSASWTSNVTLPGGWAWVKDSSGSQNPVVVSGCGSALTCAYRIFGDGHAEARGVCVETACGLTAVGPQIHVAPAHLTLVVDSSHVASGSQVKFTARRSDGVQPVAVQSWVWAPGDSSPLGPLAVDCVGGDSLCITLVQNTTPADSTGTTQTGTMTAIAVLGTASESASVAVAVDRPVPDTGCQAAPLASTRLTASTRAPSKTALTPRTRLECGGGGGGAGDSIHISIDRDTISGLYPRIRAGTVNGITVPEHEPDTANVQVTVFAGGRPAPLVSVTVRAEFLPLTGGHAHVKTPVGFESAPRLTTGPETGNGLMGYFFTAPDQKHNGVAAFTDGNGMVATKLVAGYLGGRARVIASAGVIGREVAETVIVGYAVPGLVSLQTHVDSAVYWIGGTNDHPQGMNFNLQDSLANRLGPFANNLRTTVNGATLYLQFNDATLPSGGTFSVGTPSQPLLFEHPFSGGHLSHDTGLDLDVSLCYADAEGDGGDAAHRVYGRIRNGALTCTAQGGATLVGRQVDQVLFNAQADAMNGVSRIHLPSDSTHFHIRFQ